MDSMIYNPIQHSPTMSNGFQGLNQLPSPIKKSKTSFKGGSRIKVSVRIRPLLQLEHQKGHQCTKIKLKDNSVEVI